MANVPPGGGAAEGDIRGGLNNVPARASEDDDAAAAPATRADGSASPPAFGTVRRRMIGAAFVEWLLAGDA